jgi:hypothetical protein
VFKYITRVKEKQKKRKIKEETFAGHKHAVIFYNYETNLRAKVFYKIRFSMGSLGLPTQTTHARERLVNTITLYVGKETS